MSGTIEDRCTTAKNLTNDLFPHIVELTQKLEKPLFFFDTETTGFTGNPDTEILEIAFVEISKEGLFYDATFVKNTKPIPEVVINIHGICEEMAQQGICFEEMYSMITEKMKACVLSGFNIRSYDIVLFNDIAERYGLPRIDFQSIDVRDMHIKRNGGNWKGKLGELCASNDLPVIDAHQAMGDVVMTMHLMEYFLKKDGQKITKACYLTAKTQAMLDKLC